MTLGPSHIEPFHVMLAALAVFGALNLVLVVRTALGGLRGWRTVKAARALVDVHLDAMEASTASVIARSASLEHGGRRLGTAASGLSGSFGELRYLLARIPEERTRLRNAVVELLLPTDPDPEADRP